MNLPPAWPPQPQAPQQPMQQFPPQQQPQAPMQPQPGWGAPPPGVQGAASTNLMNTFLATPPRQRINRAKPADGSHVVQFKPSCKQDYSQKDAQAYLLIEYRVIESTVPANVGGEFGTVIKLVTRSQLENLAELLKAMLGADGVRQIMAQNYNPVQLAQMAASTLVQGRFAFLQTRRSPKQVQQVGYEEAFVNHDFLLFHTAPFSLAQGQQATRVATPAPAPAAPQGQMQAPQQPQMQPQMQAPPPMQQPQMQPQMQAPPPMQQPPAMFIPPAPQQPPRAPFPTPPAFPGQPQPPF